VGRITNSYFHRQRNSVSGFCLADNMRQHVEVYSTITNVWWNSRFGVFMFCSRRRN